MTNKHRKLTLTIIATVLTIIGCTVTLIFAPVVAPIIALVGGALIAAGIEQTCEAFNDEQSDSEVLPPIHMVTLHRHISETDSDGNHRRVVDTREIISDSDDDTDEPPPRAPTRFKL